MNHKQIYLQLKKWKPPKLRLNYTTIDYNKLYITVESLGLAKAANSYEELETTTKIVNPPREEWVNNEIIIGINLRNYLWVQHKKDEENETKLIEFKKIRDEIARLIQLTKNTYYYNLFNKYTNTPKKMWKLINNLATNKMYQNSAPLKLIMYSYQRILGTIALMLVIFRLIVEASHDGLDSANSYDAYDTYLRYVVKN
ncbi:hypothetical protein HW555_012153 [Spodoptera exigua]|uniref:Uncharacterized protein n=1 Tax=Spodoptera exigua TaxID=7107 RepID=A0A835G813_SPOEX|nr:hypothetical protein HW555_012153 [Spodoptera exigua]